MSRRPAAGQTEVWVCPNCGATYTAEDTGERIKSRNYGGTKRIMRFYDQAGAEVVKCTCGRFLHWLYNGVDSRRLRRTA